MIDRDPNLPRDRLVKRIADHVHDGLARGPRPLAEAYLAMISLLSRNLFPPGLAARAHNSVCGYSRGRHWPAMTLAPRRARMGTSTEVRLIPELSGFEAEVLFSKKFGYEPALVHWLEANVVANYDLVIEIGANVGIYTVFLDALYRAGSPKPGTTPRIVCFEPSREAYRRLSANLAANPTRYVHSYQAAVAATSGLASFFEPRHHLTNGSFVRDFSAIFTDEVIETVVVTVAASELERWLESAPGRTLIKLDVEGFEPQLLDSLKPVIDKHRPDIVIEVLPFTLDALNDSAALAGYERHHVTMEGLVRSDAFHASDDHYDWLLRFRR